MRFLTQEQQDFRDGRLADFHLAQLGFPPVAQMSGAQMDQALAVIGAKAQALEDQLYGWAGGKAAFDAKQERMARGG